MCWKKKSEPDTKVGLFVFEDTEAVIKLIIKMKKSTDASRFKSTDKVGIGW